MVKDYQYQMYLNQFTGRWDSPLRKFQDGGEVMSDMTFQDIPEDTEEAPQEEVVQEEVYDALPILETGAGNDFDETDDIFNGNRGLFDSEIDYESIEPTLGNEPHHGNAPITQLLSHFKNDLGLTPSSVMSGKHNTGSKHYHGKALDLGLNTSFGGDMKKMRQFKDYFLEQQRQGKYTNIRLLDETVRPKGQKVWGGAHLHFEIND